MKKSPRECFFLDELDQYFYTEKFILSDDIFIDLKFLISSYSAGIPLKSFDAIFEAILNNNYDNTTWVLDNIDDYYFAITLVSIFWLRAKNKDIKKLEKLVPFREDRLLSYIAMGTDNVDYSKTIYNLDPFVYLHNFVIDNNRTEANILTFLDHFYFAFKGKSWFESHTKKKQSFFGYWSFSLAAIVDKLNTQDISFIDNMYYPRDLLGRKLMPTWEDSDPGLLARAQKESIQKIYNAKNKHVLSSRENLIKKDLFSYYKNTFLSTNTDILQLIFFKKFKKSVEEGKANEIMSNPSIMKMLMTSLADSILKTDLQNVLANNKFNGKKLARIAYLKMMTDHQIKYHKEMSFLEGLITDKSVSKMNEEILFLFFELAKDLVILDKKYTYTDKEYWNKIDVILNQNGLQHLFQ